MNANRHLTKIIISMMTVAVVICLIAVIFSDRLNETFGHSGFTMEYETELFNTDQVITIDIQMKQKDWEAMLANASAEEYVKCDVVVNGKKIKNVAIRPKGNSSLSTIVSNPDTDRYSLSLEFDHYVEGQTCFGLDKLILNNNYGDATSMKEALIYDMFGYLGADASLYNFAKISVNGEYWGVYLALEAVDDSFLRRNYGLEDGELYKPENMAMGGNKNDNNGAGGGFNFGNMPDMANFKQRNNQADAEVADGAAVAVDGMPDMADFNPFEMFGGGMPDMANFDFGNMPDMGNFNPANVAAGNIPDAAGFGNAGAADKAGFANVDVPAGENQTAGADGGEVADAAADRKNARNGFGFGGGGSNGGSNLNYTDDELSSYSTIWNGEKTKTTDSDHRRVVTALKNISEGTNLEKYMDIDNLLRFMAVHTLSVNMDSLSGNMSHNYYLYESDGKLNMIPWDYNLALGGMSMGSGGGSSDLVNFPIDTPFPGTKFFDALLADETYSAKYHEYLLQLVDYIEGGKLEQVIGSIRKRIDTLTETDPTAFYDYDAYNTAVETLYDVLQLRAKSISGQVEGSIPSTSAGQTAHPELLVDSSGVNTSLMGSMGGMGGKNRWNRDEAAENTEAAENADTAVKPDAEVKPDAMPTDFSTKADVGNADVKARPDVSAANAFPKGDAENVAAGARPDAALKDFSPNAAAGNVDANARPDAAPKAAGMDADKVDAIAQPTAAPAEPASDAATDNDAADGNAQQRREQAGRSRSFGTDVTGQTATRNKNLLIMGICLAALVAGMIAASLFRRKKYVKGGK